MRDEFPEQKPNGTTRRFCLQGQRQVTLACIDLSEEDMSFPEFAEHLSPLAFLKTQREKFEEARLRSLVGSCGSIGKQGQTELRNIDKQLVRAKTKRRLLRKKRASQIQSCLAELRSREAEGYSARQLIRSHIPEVGGEMKVSEKEVTAAIEAQQVAILSITSY